MAINKVIYDNRVLVDLTNDTVVDNKLVHGYTAHDKSGQEIIGSLKNVPLEPYIYDMRYGYISAGSWIYEDPTNTYIDIYEVISGHSYFITLGKNVGSRFRTMFTVTDVSTSTVTVAGTRILDVNNPASFRNAGQPFTAPDNGYILVAKDNVGKSGIFSYVYDCNEGWI